jgi:hypothetical protein
LSAGFKSKDRKQSSVVSRKVYCIKKGWIWPL